MENETKQARDLFPADLRKRMVKNYNKKLAEIQFLAVQSKRVSKDDPVPTITEEDAVKMATAAIEKRLGLMAGSTLPEIASKLAVMFGTTGSAFQYEDLGPTIPNKEMTKEKRLVMNKKEADARAIWNQKRKEEIAEFSVVAREYIYGFGQEIKDPLGITIRVGEQITVDRGHYKKLY